MMTGSIGRQLLRLAGVLALAGFTVSCASPQHGATVAPAGYGKDPASRAERLVSYCDRLADKGELVTALGLCARAHEIDRENPETLMKIAAILKSMNRQQAAVQTYVILLDQNPGHHEARYSLGKLYMETGDSDLASMQFTQAMRSDPKDPRPYNALGILHDQVGEHATAQALYRTALTQDPKNHSLRNNLGLSLALDGKRDEAIEVLAELAVDPEAGQTVLRNLEAAYASRPAAPQAQIPGSTVPGSAAPEALAVPVAPVASEPLELPAEMPAPKPAAMTAPPSASGDAAPTPLFVPPAATAGEPQQSGAHVAPEVSQPSSVILAAAARLMQPPAWADFEPGTLIGSGIGSGIGTGSAPVVPQEATPSDGAVSVFGTYDLSMLFVDHATSNA
ncbi:MAG: tetratricopeptide repeat protein [Kiloniellaceae bacterium]